MGYLLPVHFTQYQEYQNRIKRVKGIDRQNVKVDRVKRIYLSQNNNLLENNTKHNKKTENSADQIFAELTGTGRNFDARI